MSSLLCLYAEPSDLSLSQPMSAHTFTFAILFPRPAEVGKRAGGCVGLSCLPGLNHNTLQTYWLSSYLFFMTPWKWQWSLVYANTFCFHCVWGWSSDSKASICCNASNQTGLQKAYLILHVLLMLMRTEKKLIFILGWSNLIIIKWTTVTYRLFRELFVPLELILQHTFPYTSFPSIWEMKNVTTSLFLKCKLVFNSNATYKYVIWVY